MCFPHFGLALTPPVRLLKFPELLELNGPMLIRGCLQMLELLVLPSLQEGAKNHAVPAAREYWVRGYVQLKATPSPTNAELYDAAYDDLDDHDDTFRTSRFQNA